MIAYLGLSGLYYALMLHTQYFYFYFGKDSIEFNLRIGKRSKDVVTLSLKEIGSINKGDDEYHIILKTQGRYSVNTKKIEYLIGSELLKKKLENFSAEVS